MRRSATVLDRTFRRHVHRIVALWISVRGAHPTIDSFACAHGQNDK